jgi:inorganic pyrophosphatase
MPTPSKSRRPAKKPAPPTGPASPFRPHPWHGIAVGPAPPDVLNVFVEITPFDLMKYEVDKVSGYLRVDRPQRTSSQPPSLYGFIPRTYCHERVCRLTPEADHGDGDPLDICVLSERPISRAEIIVPARVVGGFQLLDGGEADDKIIAVLEKDFIWGGVEDVTGLPEVLVERLHHYFMTYKLVPGEDQRIRVQRTYGKEHALKVIETAMADYEALVSTYAPD